MFVVTAATGKLGQKVIEALLAKVPAKDVAVVVRNPDKAAAFAAKGVEVRRGDYADAASLRSAFRAGDRVLLISGSEVGQRATQHRNAIDAAKAAGVKLLAYTSILGADSAKMALAGEHLETERMVEASGVPYVLLRHGWYTENYTDNLGPALEHGLMMGSAKDGKVAIATRADYAAADVAVLTGEGHEGKTYELAGDTSLTLSELASAVAEASGKAVAYKDLPAGEYEAALKSFGVPGPMAHVLADSDVGLSRGELDTTSKDLSRLAGRPTTPLKTVLASVVRN